MKRSKKNTLKSIVSFITVLCCFILSSTGYASYAEDYQDTDADNQMEIDGAGIPTEGTDSQLHIDFQGNGTEGDPYIISGIEALRAFRNLVNAGNAFDYTFFKQTEDIDLSEEENWEPIGIFGSGNYFWGFYDGDGHTINHLNINRPEENVGLFGVLAGEVSNLGIESGNIYGMCVGSIAGHGFNTAVIYNCYNKADVHGIARSGGIADNFAGRIINTINLGSVKSDTDISAGILAYDCLLVERCYSVDIRPVNNYFTGEMNHSGKISALDTDFLNRFYKDSLEDEKRNTVYMTINDEGLGFSSIRSGIGKTVKLKDYLPYKGDVLNATRIDNSKISFSHQSGSYDESFDLEIYAPSDEIYYTTDGSEPDKTTGIRYVEPIHLEDKSSEENVFSARTDVSTEFLPEDYLELQEYDLMGFQIPETKVDKCNVIRAVYYDAAGNKSDSISGTFFVGYQNHIGYKNISVISIITEPDNLFSKNDGIYVRGAVFDRYDDLIKQGGGGYWFQWPCNYTQHGLNWERVATLQMFNSDGKLCLSQDVGIRIQGNATRGFACKSLNIYARADYGNNRINYDFWNTGFIPQRATLFAGGGDRYSKIRDRLASQLCGKLAFQKMHFKPCAVFLDGEYWGLYYLTEKYDEEYLKWYCGIDKDNAVIIKKGQLEEGTDEDLVSFQRDMHFLETTDMTIEDNYNKACEILDMDCTLDYFAAEIYFGEYDDWMIDWNNTALWKSREKGSGVYEDGKWRWMMYDQNGIAWQDYASVDNLSFHLQNTKLIKNLCENDGFRNGLIDRVFYFGASLSGEKIEEILNDYFVELNSPMKLHLNRYFNRSIKPFLTELAYIKDFFSQRYDMMVSYFRNSFSDDDVDVIALKYAELEGIKTISSGYLRLNNAERDYIKSMSAAPIVAEAWINQQNIYKSSTKTQDRSSVVFLGDSLTANNDFSKVIPEATNRGIGGDKIEGIIARFDNIATLKPEKLFLLIGINNFPTGIGPDGGYIFLYDKLFSMIKEELPNTEVYIQAILPINTAMRTDIPLKKIQALNSILRKLTAIYNYEYVDTYTLFDTDGTGLAEADTIDGLHLSQRGKQKYYDFIKSYVYDDEYDSTEVDFVLSIDDSIPDEQFEFNVDFEACTSTDVTSGKLLALSWIQKAIDEGETDDSEDELYHADYIGVYKDDVYQFAVPVDTWEYNLVAEETTLEQYIIVPSAMLGSGSYKFYPMREVDGQINTCLSHCLYTVD